MNAVCFEETGRRMVEAATSMNSLLFEQVANSITDFQDTMKSFIEDERKRRELHAVSYTHLTLPTKA